MAFFPMAGRTSLSIEAKFCKRVRLGATYCMLALYHCRLRDVCTVCNYILARAKGAYSGLGFSLGLGFGFWFRFLGSGALGRGPNRLGRYYYI